MTNAEARCNKSLRPWKPEGSLGRTAQDGHLDSHTAPELCVRMYLWWSLCTLYLQACQVRVTIGDSGLCKGGPLVEFIYLVFTNMPDESYRRQLKSLLLHLCYVF